MVGAPVMMTEHMVWGTAAHWTPSPISPALPEGAPAHPLLALWTCVTDVCRVLCWEKNDHNQMTILIKLVKTPMKRLVESKSETSPCDCRLSSAPGEIKMVP